MAQPEKIRPQLGKTYIRILGRQLDRFIEFEFILNDETLTVELVMPDRAFAEFCEYYEAEILPDEKTGEVISLQDIKNRTAGLLQTPTA
jgi:hypothetical protein